MIISQEWQKNTINFILDKYFYDTWLRLYNFSKLIKIGVNLRVPNGWVFKIPVKYIINISQCDSCNIYCLSELISELLRM